MARFDLSDDEWAVIEPLLPKDGRGPTRKDDRKVLNGIFCISRNCAPWRDLPEQYGPYTTVYNRYNVWGERGVWKGIFDALTDECDNSLIFIDASIGLRQHDISVCGKILDHLSPHARFHGSGA